MAMDWAAFLEGEMARREERRAHAWRLLGYALAAFGATGWYLLGHPPAATDGLTYAALGTSGIAFVLLVSPALDRLLRGLDPESTPRGRLLVEEGALGGLIRRVGHRRLLHLPRLAEAVAALFAAALLAEAAARAWSQDRFETISLGVLGVIALGVAGSFAFSPAMGRRMAHDFDLTRLFTHERAPRAGGGAAPKGGFFSWISRVGAAIYRGAALVYGLLIACGFLLVGAYWLLKRGLREPDFVAETLGVGAVASTFLLGLVAAKLLLVLAHDDSLRILGQLRYAVLSEGGSARLDDRRLRHALALLDVMRAERLPLGRDIDEFLEKVSIYERASSGSASPDGSAAPRREPSQAEASSAEPSPDKAPA